MKKKNEKCLGGATGPQSFIHKVNGIFGQNFQTLISGPKKSQTCETEVDVE